MAEKLSIYQLSLVDILVFGSSLNEEEFIYFSASLELPLEFVFSDGHKSAGQVRSHVGMLEIHIFAENLGKEYVNAIEQGSNVLSRLKTKLVDNRDCFTVPKKHSICFEYDRDSHQFIDDSRQDASFDLLESLKRVATTIALQAFNEKETPISSSRLSSTSLSYGVRFHWRTGLVIILELDSSGDIHSTFFEAEGSRVRKGKLKRRAVQDLGWSVPEAIVEVSRQEQKAA